MMKGNDGMAARRRSARQILGGSACLLVLVVVGILSLGDKRHHGGPTSTARGGIGRSGGGGASGRQPYGSQKQRRQVQRRRTGDGRHAAAAATNGKERDDPHERAVQYRWDLVDQFESPEEELKLLDDVLDGRLHLVDLEVVGEEMEKASEDSYEGVYGSFCKLNFAIHKANPSSVPMFRDIVSHSSQCKDPFQLDLKRIVYLARQRDQQVQESDDDEEVPKVLNFTLAAFHESRCGSTLVANTMIAMDPMRHRTYSESPPPLEAMSDVCGEDFSLCTSNQAALVLQDVIYMMSRTDDPKEERVFFKFQSVTSKSISVFQLAFPDVPWMYVYREPVQVMMSHVKDDPKLRRAVCTRSIHGRPSKILMEIAKRQGRRVKDLERVEYCAAHLASLTESAVNNLNDMAIPVNYNKLPNIMWETIMPKIFGRPLTQKEINNMEEVSRNYSKGRGKKGGEFHGDSKEKEKSAPAEVRDAAKSFLLESYEKLNDFQPMLLNQS